MRMRRTSGKRRLRLAAIAVIGTAAVLVPLGGTASGAPLGAAPVTINLVGLPIANGLPLDLGIKQGFFQDQGITISKRNLQSGNDVALALSNNQGEIGYLGWAVAILARTQGIRLQAIAASDVEGTSAADNWQNILVKGSSSIRTPADLAGKTIAVNALKAVGEVMVKAALKKRGVDPDSIRLLAMPFPSMPSALENGQVDAIWTPEPFMTQALNNGARIVLAPGPELGKFFPIGVYVGRQDWIAQNPGVVSRFRTANPNQIRELLPAATRNIRLPIWSPLADRAQLVQLAKLMKEYGAITTLPNLAVLVPSAVTGGKTLQGSVGNRFIFLRQDGKPVTRLATGRYTFVVQDASRTQAFRLTGPGVSRTTPVAGTGRSTWTLTLRRGTYVFRTTGKPLIKRTFRVS
jgi:NitT/TauT family transport system substrate-binding protein